MQIHLTWIENLQCFHVCSHIETGEILIKGESQGGSALCVEKRLPFQIITLMASLKAGPVGKGIQKMKAFPQDGEVVIPGEISR